MYYYNTILLLFGTCYFFYISGLVIFMNGLISSNTYKLHSTPHNLLNVGSQAVREGIYAFHRKHLPKLYSNHSQKVIIMLIDALRVDFIPSLKYNAKFNVSMPYTEHLLKSGFAISFVSKGYAPTVTLPRIKTLVTGTIANFIDILLNFNAAELDNDNILKQASIVGRRSVFYGDDTWLKLFPNTFIRSEGTHSFFVTDFEEVDLNVSRHIKYEIDSRNDWDILILHFLGVDHIGHAYGPYSEHLPLKLLQMDEIIKFMHENMKNDPPSLIILCGDHGMTMSGSHGGITQDELLTPIIFMSTSNHKLDSKNSVIDQVDLAPTLSSVLGLPIPENSLGQIIPDVLKFVGFTNYEILNAMYFNFLQISKIYENIFPSNVKYSQFTTEIVESHYKALLKNNTLNDSDYMHLINLYETLLRNMKSDLLNVLTGYDDFSLLLGLLIMWSSIFSFYILLPLDFNKNYKISNKGIPSILSVMFVAIIACTYLNIYLLIIPFSIPFLFFKYLNEKDHFTFTEKICLFLLLVHALSLFSSSYIEEEHQTWYFFTCSVATLICCKKLYLFLKIQSIKIKSNCDLKIFWSECSSTIFFPLLVLLLHRIFCKWNQVGNKWQHLPDISDWLNQKENAIYLAILMMISHFILMFYFKHKLESLNFVLFTSSQLFITLQKLDSLGLFPYFKTFSKQMLIPQAIYALIIFIVASSFFKLHLSVCFSKSMKVKRLIINFISAWILLIETIGRAHNVPLIVITLVQESLINRMTMRNNFSTFFTTICYFIMAMTSFAFYGNSNSLSTIDVYTGYTGIQSYVPFVVGFLLVCNTYSIFILWLTLLFYRLMHLNYDFEKLAVKVKLTFLYLLEYKLTILCLYCIVMFLMRHHLFIYSVFFPKLFYEICHVILTSICFFCYFCYS